MKQTLVQNSEGARGRFFIHPVRPSTEGPQSKEPQKRWPLGVKQKIWDTICTQRVPRHGGSMTGKSRKTEGGKASLQNSGPRGGNRRSRTNKNSKAEGPKGERKRVGDHLWGEELRNPKKRVYHDPGSCRVTNTVWKMGPKSLNRPIQL